MAWRVRRGARGPGAHQPLGVDRRLPGRSRERPLHDLNRRGRRAGAQGASASPAGGRCRRLGSGVPAAVSLPGSGASKELCSGGRGAAWGGPFARRRGQPPDPQRRTGRWARPASVPGGALREAAPPVRARGAHRLRRRRAPGPTRLRWRRRISWRNEPSQTRGARRSRIRTAAAGAARAVGCECAS